MTEAPQKAILGLGTTGYFNLMTKLMGSAAPPAPEDAPMLARMAKIGIVPGKPFDPSKLDPAVQAALKDVPAMALKRITAAWESSGKDVNGWRVKLVGGRYGTNYLERATWAAAGWPSQLPNVSVFPITYVDSTGQKLSGAHKYTLTFPKGQLPGGGSGKKRHRRKMKVGSGPSINSMGGCGWYPGVGVFCVWLMVRTVTGGRGRERKKRVFIYSVGCGAWASGAGSGGPGTEQQGGRGGGAGE